MGLNPPLRSCHSLEIVIEFDGPSDADEWLKITPASKDGDPLQSAHIPWAGIPPVTIGVAGDEMLSTLLTRM